MVRSNGTRLILRSLTRNLLDDSPVPVNHRSCVSNVIVQSFSVLIAWFLMQVLSKSLSKTCSRSFITGPTGVHADSVSSNCKFQTLSTYLSVMFYLLELKLQFDLCIIWLVDMMNSETCILCIRNSLFVKLVLLRMLLNNNSMIRDECLRFF